MTQDEIIRFAIQCRLVTTSNRDGLYMDALTEFAKLVAAKEREDCAEVCDSFYLSWINIQGRYEFMGEGASECAGAIRARGEA